MSPTQLTLRYLKRNGYQAAIVEKYNPFAKVRQDVFGIGDILACNISNGIYLIQTTSGSNHSARRTKALAEPRLKTWLQSGGRFLIVSWTKKSDRWMERLEEITAEDFENK